jgi:predicted alpha/beta-fold hydrolase
MMQEDAENAETGDLAYYCSTAAAAATAASAGSSTGCNCLAKYVGMKGESPIAEGVLLLAARSDRAVQRSRVLSLYANNAA